MGNEKDQQYMYQGDDATNASFYIRRGQCGDRNYYQLEAAVGSWSCCCRKCRVPGAETAFYCVYDEPGSAGSNDMAILFTDGWKVAGLLSVTPVPKISEKEP